MCANCKTIKISHWHEYLELGYRNNHWRKYWDYGKNITNHDPYSGVNAYYQRLKIAKAMQNYARVKGVWYHVDQIEFAGTHQCYCGCPICKRMEFRR